MTIVETQGLKASCFLFTVPGLVCQVCFKSQGSGGEDISFQLRLAGLVQTPKQWEVNGGRGIFTKSLGFPLFHTFPYPWVRLHRGELLARASYLMLYHQLVCKAPLQICHTMVIITFHTWSSFPISKKLVQGVYHNTTFRNKFALLHIY